MDTHSTERTLWEFSDGEYAVIYDSLVEMRDKLRKKGIATPNIDSALAKFSGWARPSGCEFLVVTGVDMALIKGASE